MTLALSRAAIADATHIRHPQPHASAPANVPCGASGTVLATTNLQFFSKHTRVRALYARTHARQSFLAAGATRAPQHRTHDCLSALPNHSDWVILPGQKILVTFLPADTRREILKMSGVDVPRNSPQHVDPGDTRGQHADLRCCGHHDQCRPLLALASTAPTAFLARTNTAVLTAPTIALTDRRAAVLAASALVLPRALVRQSVSAAPAVVLPLAGPRTARFTALVFVVDGWPAGWPVSPLALRLAWWRVVNKPRVHPVPAGSALPPRVWAKRPSPMASGWTPFGPTHSCVLSVRSRQPPQRAGLPLRRRP